MMPADAAATTKMADGEAVFSAPLIKAWRRPRFSLYVHSVTSCLSQFARLANCIDVRKTLGQPNFDREKSISQKQKHSEVI